MFSAASKSVSSGGYQIDNSLRFRSSASAYLNRTPSVAGNQRTWTWSGWVKLGAIQAGTNIFGCTTDNYNVNYFALYFHSTLGIRFENVSGGATQLGANITSQVFRDPSAWYHIILAIDTTQSTASNRVKFYVNGVQVTNWAQTSYPAQNAVLLVNSTIQHDISSSNAGLSKFDGYMAEVNFIDGQALTPSSFGSINATTGVWQPARYTGSYGTNGFYLKFNNGTSTTTLGNDSSGNGNNWTTNNISLTAGSTYDWMIDSPTSYAGSSYGVGNYAVLNPLDGTGSGISFINGNLGASWTSNANRNYFGNFVLSTGKWYFENIQLSGPDTDVVFGIVSSAFTSGTVALAGNSNFYGYTYAGRKWNAGTNTDGNPTFTVNSDVMCWAIDCDSGKIWLGKNGSWLSSGNPATGANPYYTFTANTPMKVGGPVYNAVFAYNFGQRPFQFSPPSGFKSLNTYNLP